MRGVDHQLQGGIDDGARFFGVEVLLQLGRALDVSKQCGDRLALALQSFGRSAIEPYANARRVWRFRPQGLANRGRAQRCRTL